MESFHLEHSTDILALCENNLNSSISPTDLTGYLFLFRKDCSIHIHGLDLYVREHHRLARERSLAFPDCPYMYLQLSLITTVSSSSHDCYVLDRISGSIDKALSRHPFANIFVFCDFNANRVKWLNYSNVLELLYHTIK